MSDKDFWTRFFQASHFHRQRVSGTSSQQMDLFSECMEKEVDGVCVCMCA